MKTRTLKVTKIQLRGEPRFQVYLGVFDGVRKYKTFRTHGEADAFRKRKQREFDEYGRAALRFSDELRMDAVIALKMLPEGVSLIDAAKCYLANNRRSDVTVEAAIKALVQARKESGVRPRTIETISTTLETFSAGRKDALLSDITTAEIEETLKSNGWAASTQGRFLANVNNLFNFAIKRDWISKNPASKISRPKVEKGLPGIYAIDEIKRWIQGAREFGGTALLYVGVGIFTGIRAAEIKRLTEKSFANGHIVIESKESKTWQVRSIPIRPPLKRLIDEAQSMGYSLPVPSNFKRTFPEIAKKIGVKIIHNGFRHSFASYHLAHFNDLNQLREEMGHMSERMTWGHYIHRSRMINKEDAAAFWSLQS